MTDANDDTAPRVEYVGRDNAEAIRGTIRALGERQAAGELELRKKADRYECDARETVWCLVTEHQRLRESDPPRYSAETVSELPIIGRVKTPTARPTAKWALADLRTELAKHWAAHKVCKDYAAARERAARVELAQQIIPGAA